jgi:hypothetical protein
MSARGEHGVRWEGQWVRARSRKQAIRATLFRLGLQAGADGVMRVLAAEGVHVSTALVCQVKFEMLQERPGRLRPAPRRPLGGVKWRAVATRRPPQSGS